MKAPTKPWSMPGCEGRFYVRGKKNIIWYRKNGQKTNFSTRLPYSPDNRHLAARKAQELEIPGINENNYLLSELYKEFLTNVQKSKNKSTLEQYGYAMNALIANDHPIRNYKEIREDIQWNINDKILSPATLKSYLSRLRSFFNWCIECEYLEKQPIISSMKQKVPSKPVELFTKDELEAIFNYWTKKDHEFFILLQLLYKLALRRNEALRLKWEVFILPDGKFRDQIIIGKSKFGNKIDYLPLSEPIIELLESLNKKKNGKIFRWKNVRTIHSMLEKSLVYLGIPKSTTSWAGNGRSLHTLRKCKISEWLFVDDLSIQKVSKLSRDSIQTIMKFYAACEASTLKHHVK